MKPRLLAVCLLAASTLPVQADEPVIGGWRKAANENETREYRFAMLPKPVAKGTRFVAVDWKSRKLICCLTVQSAEISEDTLRDQLKIPNSRICDLVNGWSMDQAPYRPRIFSVTADGALKNYQFAGEPAFMHGGLLLPEDSQMDAKGRLFIGEARYRANFSVRALGDDDGAVHVYTIKPISGGKTAKVEVPFGNN